MIAHKIYRNMVEIRYLRKIIQPLLVHLVIYPYEKLNGGAGVRHAEN